MQRNKSEKFLDLLLTLYSIELAKIRVKAVTILMIQKIIFLTAIQYREELIRVLSQSFYRWHRGPMSDEVYSDFNDLTNYGLITGDYTKDIQITDRGKKLLDSTFGLIQQEKHFINPLRVVASNVNRLDELMKKVYAKEVFVEEKGKVLPIANIPEGMHILTPVWRDEAKESMVLDKAWIETLDLMMVPEVDDKIRKSMEDAKKGKLHPMEMS